MNPGPHPADNILLIFITTCNRIYIDKFCVHKPYILIKYRKMSLYLKSVIFYCIYCSLYFGFFLGSETRTKCDAGVGKFERLSGNFSI